MREIAAASDFDFVALEPPRPKKAKAVQRVAAAPKKPSPLARLWRFRVPAFGGLVMVGLLGGIMFNAMFLQHGRHPAPLLGGATLRIAPPSPPPRPAGFSPLLNDQIPRPALQKVVAAPDAAFAAPTAAVEDEPAGDAPPPAAPLAVAPPPVRPAATPNHAAEVKHARPAASQAHVSRVAAPQTHVSRVAASQDHVSRVAAPVPGPHVVQTPTHPAKAPTHAAHAAKKAPDPIAALLAGGGH